MKLFENFNKPIRLRKNIVRLCERSINKGQSIYVEFEMSHNVVYLFSICDEMSHNVVYLFSICDEMSDNVVYGIYFQPKFGQLPSECGDFTFSS